MTDLISRLEKSRKGSRKLSDEVLLSLGWHKKDLNKGRALWCSPDGSSGWGYDLRPDPTRSIDDAIKLRADNWEVSFVVEADGRASASIWDRLGDITPNRATIYDGATPALALCIALVKMAQGSNQ